MGLTMSQWDALDEHDRAWALGADVAEAEDAAERCTQCGGPAALCQDPDNQHAFVVTFTRCYRTRAIREAEKKRTDHDGVIAHVTFDPTRKKSARKGARRG
ncbi:hypothetical protein H9L10_03520 [Phycicoccus endophyticus]|uniref:Uncharacterized protein n=1 Tax=Phycicoccus endophyticus TaxID=1690220 RepID=A0A7G9R3G3_9MICO|nr:hypothetical protein [Phycicoccus endophyticus]NHI19894.1 hypothetical protein [Phycicoccus endophyticus]QNN50138.1 hypothetical protein H9L10_03520 [Phycicoccus endophyticus]GGL27700.1 hypothetical protein GCM10012283_07390 [Phycicoccus endophyticus]